jgi:hypothetical protein
MLMRIPAILGREPFFAERRLDGASGPQRGESEPYHEVLFELVGMIRTIRSMTGTNENRADLWKDPMRDHVSDQPIVSPPTTLRQEEQAAWEPVRQKRCSEIGVGKWSDPGFLATVPETIPPTHV